jgi:selenide, water dikinase
VGIETSDDAGVFKLNSDLALVQTLDFLTPVTNSPYEFGQIAAANSLSDVYAMGGTPLTVMNIVCFSCDVLNEDILGETLKGGMDKINEAGATLLGGHSINDKEFKYGLSVTGTVHPKKVWANKGANPGDALILTKPVGTGIIATAIKAKLADDDLSKKAAGVMSQLNKYAAEIIKEFNVNACTDVTGFGLAGHMLEMAKAGLKRITLFSDKVPIIEGVAEFAKMGIVPAGAHKNREFCKNNVKIDSNIEKAVQDIFFDPQTSGGLMVSMDKKHAETCVEKLQNKGIDAAIIGEVNSDNSQGFLEII